MLLPSDECPAVFLWLILGLCRGFSGLKKRHLCVSKKRFGVWTETHLRFPLNALTFEIKRPCVLIQTQGRFFEGGNTPQKSSEIFQKIGFILYSERDFYLLILLHVSFNDTVRLNTRCSGVESLSTLK